MSRSSQALPGSLSSQVPMIDTPEARRFPSPWVAEETDACFIIRDHSGYASPMSISRMSPAGARRRTY